MGWIGTYKDCPKGQDRVTEAIMQEGYSFVEPNRSSRVIGSALVGTTVYLAVKYDSENLHCVYGAVILTAYVKERGEFLTKGMSESMIPYAYDCPKRILDMLTPADDANAKEWRKLCEERRAQKRKDALNKMPVDGCIRLNGYDGIYQAYMRKNRKVFVNWMTSRYVTPAQARRVGYELIEK